MPNLYSIRFMHYAPKDSVEGIIAYAIANNDNEIYEFIKSEPRLNDSGLFNTWKDLEEEEFDIYSEDWEVIGAETHRERMLRLCGEMYDEEAEVENAYYGITHYGWKLESLITEEEAQMFAIHIKALDLRKQ